MYTLYDGILYIYTEERQKKKEEKFFMCLIKEVYDAIKME